MVHWGGADGRSEAVVLAVEVPGHSGAPLSKCMRHVGAWARRMQAEAHVPSDRRTHGPMVFRVDSMHHVDRWAPVQGGAIVPVLVDGQPPRSIDAMVRVKPLAMPLWMQHVASLEALVQILPEDPLADAVAAEGLPRALRPMIGIGCTIVHGRAMYPATIHRITEDSSKIGVRRDMVDHLPRISSLSLPCFTAHPSTPIEWYERGPRGIWVSLAEPRLPLHVGSRNYQAVRVSAF